MSVGTCIGIIVGSIVISCGLSEIGKIGRARNEYDDYIQAVLDILKYKKYSESPYAHLFSTSKELSEFIDKLLDDLRAKFLGGEN